MGSSRVWLLDCLGIVHVLKTQWYRVFSDSWIEQGGEFWSYSSTADNSTAVTFPKPFNTDAYYNNVISSWGGNSGWQYFGGCWINDTSTTTMRVHHSLGSGSNDRFRWFVSGH